MGSSNLPISTVVGLTAGVIAITTISYLILNKKRQQKQTIPKNIKWKHIGHVGEIAIYPVRSGAAVLLDKVQCKKDGLHSTTGFRDRSLLLLNEHDKIACADTYPNMLKIKCEILNENVIKVKASNMPDLELNVGLMKLTKAKITKELKACKMHLIEADDEHHEWFSKVVLDRAKGFKLFIQLHIETERSIWGGEKKSNFVPLMIMNNKSVDDLNNRLRSSNNKAHHLQFRGNLLIKCLDDIQPYDEDNWCWLKIGNDESHCTILHYRDPCLRCILPNIDIETCKRNPDFEPLKTLKKYRLIHHDKEPTLGAYYGVSQQGAFSLNEKVYVAYKS